MGEKAETSEKKPGKQEGEHQSSSQTTAKTKGGGNKESAPVVNYIALLFIAAFLLLLMTYLMEQRQTAQVLDGLRTSVSAMQSVEEVYSQNQDLLEENQALQDQEEALIQENQSLQQRLALAETTLLDQETSYQALTLLWQLELAVSQGNQQEAKDLVEAITGAGLAVYLPQGSGEQSPAQRFLHLAESLEDD